MGLFKRISNAIFLATKIVSLIQFGIFLTDFVDKKILYKPNVAYLHANDTFKINDKATLTMSFPTLIVKSMPRPTVGVE